MEHELTISKDKEPKLEVIFTPHSNIN